MCFNWNRTRLGFFSGSNRVADHPHPLLTFNASEHEYLLCDVSTEDRHRQILYVVAPTPGDTRQKLWQTAGIR